MRTVAWGVSSKFYYLTPDRGKFVINLLLCVFQFCDDPQFPTTSQSVCQC